MKPTVALLAVVGVLSLPSARAQQAAPAPAAPPVPAPAPAPEPEFSLTPMLRGTVVSGDSGRFAQDWWFHEGAAGGLDQFKYNHVSKDGWKLDLLGHAIWDENDYNLSLNLVNPKVGFVRAGFTEYRKYFDDKGGYYPLFRTPSFSLDRDMHLDIGKIYLDTGLTLPDWPILTLGYEQQFKEGQKSLVEWGGVSQTLVEPAGFLPTGSVTKRIYPSSEDINERTHIFKAGLEYTVFDIHLKDQFHYEWYRNDTARNDMVTDALTTGLAKTQTFNEHTDHGAAYNTVTLDGRPNNKLYWSVGNLYTTLGGDYGLHMITAGLPLAASDRFWVANVVNMGQESSVSEVNLKVGPFASTLLSVGVRAEDTTTHAYTTVIEASSGSPAGPIVLASNDTEKKELEETVGLRYTRIPWTTLYADARVLESETRDAWLENGDPLGNIDLGRKADTVRQNYTAGFDTAPTSRLSLSGRYRYSIKKNDYDNSLVTTPDDGYPGLLTQEKLTSNDYMVKLTLRATDKLRLFLSYQYTTTYIHNRARPINDPAAVPALVVPATDMDTGVFRSQTYSVSTTWTPVPRLYLTGMFNYQNAVSDAFRNGANSIQPYRSDIYSVIGTIGYALNHNTDVNLQYSFIHASSFTDALGSSTPPAGYTSTDYGMPYGTTSDQHGLTVNLTCKINKNTTTRLGLGYFTFHDSANDGITDYTAGSVFASYTVRF